jgi:hypothetical protein
MRRALKLHPDSHSRAVAGVEVELLTDSAGRLALSYIVSGNMNGVRIPSVTEPGRADELWRHTCFEAFVGTAAAGYYEFNFAPSTQWAAYHFSGYRSGMRVAAEAAAPGIEAQAAAESYSLRAVLDLNPLRRLSPGGLLRLGLSALIEGNDGGKSFWALAHPAGAPDFHHADCFVDEALAGAKP